MSEILPAAFSAVSNASTDFGGMPWSFSPKLPRSGDVSGLNAAGSAGSQPELERVAAAHAPADDADAAGVDVLARRQVREGVLEIGHGAVVREPAHELVRRVLISRDF